MPVYLIRAGDTDAVKIGWAEDVAARLRMLQTGNHAELRLLRTIDGDIVVEAWLHQYFGSLNIRGEWFRFSPAMLTIEPPEIAVTIDPAPARCAENIREVEARLRASQTSVATFVKRIGISRSTWTRWKAGEYAPRLDRWREIVAAVPEPADGRERAA